MYEELIKGGVEITRDLEILLKGNELRYPISETITFLDIGRNPLNIWNFLYHNGFMKADKPEPDIRGRITYRLSIPNCEIMLAYEQ